MMPTAKRPSHRAPRQQQPQGRRKLHLLDTALDEQERPTKWLTVTATLMAANIAMSSFGIPVPGGHLYLDDAIICIAALLVFKTGFLRYWTPSPLRETRPREGATRQRGGRREASLTANSMF